MAENDDAAAALSAKTVAEAERLTRLARRAVDDGEREAYRERRAAVLAEHGYTCRLRRDDAGETLVCYPAEWVADGTVRIDRVDDTDRAVEVPLDGPGEPDDWDAVDAHNRAVADRVREERGDVHGDNAAAFAAFMSNHYARRVDDATAAQVREFLAEYYPRNAWPTDAQRESVERSLELVFEAVGVEPPEIRV